MPAASVGSRHNPAEFLRRHMSSVEKVAEDDVKKTASYEQAVMMRQYLLEELARRHGDDRRCRQPFTPDSRSRLSWDISLLVLILYSAVFVPVDIGVVELNHGAYQVMERFQFAFFACDIMLNFHTAYYNSEGSLQCSHCSIARNYMKTWFFVDFVSTFPFELLVGRFLRGTVLVRLPRFAKIVKIARLLRLARVQHLLQRVFGPRLMTNLVLQFSVRFASLFVAMMLVNHWVACGFCELASWRESPHLETELHEGEEMVGWELHGVPALDMSARVRYDAAFYFSFCTVMMIKPLEIQFNTSYCRVYYMWIGVLKPIVGAAIVGVLTNMIVKQNSARGKLQAKVQTVGTFMQCKDVPVGIQHQVLAYMEHADRQVQALQDADALATLSPTLRDEVAEATMGSIVDHFAVFRAGFGSSFVRQICTVLKLELFGPDDVICEEGHALTRMVFVISGSLRLFTWTKLLPEGSTVSPFSPGCSSTVSVDEFKTEVTPAGQVREGHVFGAQALLAKRSYFSTTTALCYAFCELVFLSRADFFTVVEYNPTWQRMLRRLRARYELETRQPTKDCVDKFMEALAVCESSDALEALLSQGSRQSHSRDTFQKAVRRIIAINRQRKVTESNPPPLTFDEEHPEEDVCNSHTAGFQTLQMNCAELQLLSEVSKVPTMLASTLGIVQAKVEESVAGLNGTLSARIALSELHIKEHMMDIGERVAVLEQLDAFESISWGGANSGDVVAYV
eukprot:NODE_1484_length_2462_cov_4.674518.p1 GENE.NODE_1484_length_2462_cov_4.674518~~NODE_1484_length_2462_cov_4.674518.p1  ORF type:complete len:780 (-),score=189.50 NODE_1484_length_2462_cov_4.674518:121-2331(-)